MAIFDGSGLCLLSRDQGACLGGRGRRRARRGVNLDLATHRASHGFRRLLLKLLSLRLCRLARAVVEAPPLVVQTPRRGLIRILDHVLAWDCERVLGILSLLDAFCRQCDPNHEWTKGRRSAAIDLTCVDEVHQRIIVAGAEPATFEHEAAAAPFVVVWCPWRVVVDETVAEGEGAPLEDEQQVRQNPV